MIVHTRATRAVLHGLSTSCAAESPVDHFLAGGSDIETEAVHRMGTGRLDQRDHSNLMQTAMSEVVHW